MRETDWSAYGAVKIVCEHCGAVFVMYPETARDFYEVHGCYRWRDKK